MFCGFLKSFHNFQEGKKQNQTADSDTSLYWAHYKVSKKKASAAAVQSISSVPFQSVEGGFQMQAV